MKPWDGKDISGKYQYPLEEIKNWNMQIDENGTVYYTTHETVPRLMVWCPASHLTSHLYFVCERLSVRR